MRVPKVLLVCSPYASIDRPALGVSLLKAQLLRLDIACDVAYLNVGFAGRLGRDEYARVAEAPCLALAGDWTFARALWDRDLLDPRSYIEEVLGPMSDGCRDGVQAVLRARSLAPAFIEAVLHELPWTEYGVVGFSSSAFQNVAALGLARRVKETFPAITIVFGGQNWYGKLGRTLHRLMPFVDFALSGEADDSLPRLIQLLAQDSGGGLDSVPGLSSRRARNPQRATPELPTGDLDGLADPDYSDFFDWRARDTSLSSDPPVLPMETSRGCWWACRRGCSFCALNRRGIAYRTKSRDRILLEMDGLVKRWPGHPIEIVDNIVSPGFLDEVVPRLAARPDRPRISFKVRPDTPLRRLRSIATANASLMCGIESLSDNVLALMDKGVTSLQNVTFLERCRSLGIPVDWNLLYGAPGECPEDYTSQVELIASLPFLEPPDAVAPIILERGSAMWRESAERGFGTPRPAAAYRHVYPFAEADLADIAFFFEHDYRMSFTLSLRVAQLVRAVRAWRVRTGPAELSRESRQGPAPSPCLGFAPGLPEGSRPH